jgi:hypothetical protein
MEVGYWAKGVLYLNKKCQPSAVSKKHVNSSYKKDKTSRITEMYSNKKTIEIGSLKFTVT